MGDGLGFRYSTLGRDADARAGVMDARELLGDQPSRWQFYLQVADTDAAVSRALEAGGSLLKPVDETPYGRVASLTDPAGVSFLLMGPSAPL